MENLQTVVKNTRYPRQAILTRYHGPTNCRGPRVIARCDAGSITLEWNDALNIDENHSRAAAKLADKFGWHGEWIHGTIFDGRHVFTLNE